MEETTMQHCERWFARFAVLVLGFGLVISLTWNRMGLRGAGKDDALMARLKNTADIVEIDNLESHYSNALDSGRLGEVADLWTPTGGFGYYYEDPVTTHLVLRGQPVTSYKNEIVLPVPEPVVDRGAPLKNFAYPGCLIFGRENLSHFFREGGNSIRPHYEGWPGAPDGGGKYPGTNVSRHIIVDRWVVVNGDTAKLREYYNADIHATITEVYLVRTPEGWRFQFRKVTTNKPKADRPDIQCEIADPKFPIPSAASLGETSLTNPE